MGSDCLLFNEKVMLLNEWVDVRGSNPVTGALTWDSGKLVNDLGG